LEQYKTATAKIQEYFKGSKEKRTYFPVTLFPFFYSYEDPTGIKYSPKYLCGNSITINRGEDNAGYEYLQIAVVSYTPSIAIRTYYMFYFWYNPFYDYWQEIRPPYIIEIPDGSD
jgi:hypothetical protein